MAVSVNLEIVSMIGIMELDERYTVILCAKVGVRGQCAVKHLVPISGSVQSIYDTEVSANDHLRLVNSMGILRLRLIDSIHPTSRNTIYVKLLCGQRQ